MQEYTQTWPATYFDKTENLRQMHITRLLDVNDKHGNFNLPSKALLIKWFNTASETTWKERFEHQLRH